jgi:hypothetical protein
MQTPLSPIVLVRRQPAGQAKRFVSHQLFDIVAARPTPLFDLTAAAPFRTPRAPANIDCMRMQHNSSGVVEIFESQL